MKILEEKYGISERDFATAELEIVPAGKSRSVGFDSSFIAGHGHDDRVCSYAGVEAIFNVGDVEKSAVCLLTDKEEVGSMGNTGMQSRFFENMVANLISLQTDYNDLGSPGVDRLRDDRPGPERRRAHRGRRRGHRLRVAP